VIRIDVHPRLVRAALKLGGKTVAEVEKSWRWWPSNSAFRTGMVDLDCGNLVEGPMKRG